MKNLGTLTLVGIFAFSSAFAGDKQTKEQHKELYVKGTITVEDDVYNIRFIPGTDKIKDIRKDSWKDAGRHIENLTEKEFYEDYVVGTFKDGIEFAFDETWNKYWYAGLKKDFRKLRRVLKEKDTFGGAIGKAAAIGWFGVKALGRTVSAPFGTAGGLAYSVVAPVGSVVAQPVIASYYALLPGALAPAVLYVWNGTLWVATYSSSVPTSTSWLVRLEGKYGEELTIDAKGFQSLLAGIARQKLESEKNADLENAIEKLYKELEVLRDELDRKEDDIRDLPEVREKDEIVDELYYGSVAIDEETEAVLLNDEALESLIKGFFEDLGEDVTDELVEEVARTLKATLNDFLADPIVD